MSISLSSLDPYATLGVSKDASLADIKSAHRKLVLKCHPDKIKDESLRNEARDEFQRVQEAYELLSDDTRRNRHDQKVRIAELRKETMERTASTGSTSPFTPRSAREYRDGRIYEERVPADTTFFDDFRFTEEPRDYSRKSDDYLRRSRTAKDVDDKKKSKSTPTPNIRTPKESSREYTRSSRSEQAKHRAKERRREHEEKYERHAVHVEDYSSDSGESTVFVKVSRPSEPRRSRETPTRRGRTEPIRRGSKPSYRDEDDYSDDHAAKLNSAKDYILRSKSSPMAEVDSRHRASPSPTSFPVQDPGDRDKEPTYRHSRRTHAKPESRATSPRRSQRKSSERLDYKEYDRKVPSMPTANSSPAGFKISTSRAFPSATRSSTTPHGKPRRESSARSESTSTFLNFIPNRVDATASRSKLRPVEKYDSGYSSPGTPEMTQGTAPPKVNRYKIVEPPEPMVGDPDILRYPLGSSPPRHDRPTTARPSSKPLRTTYNYSVDSGARHDPARPSGKPSISDPSKPLYGEINFARRISHDDIKFTPYGERVRPLRRGSVY